MTINVLIPTYDEVPSSFEAAPRLASLARARIGIVSNGKHGTVPFFDALAHELQTRFGVADIVRVTKPNYSAPAGDSIMSEASQWHALVAGIGD